MKPTLAVPALICLSSCLAATTTDHAAAGRAAAAEDFPGLAVLCGPPHKPADRAEMAARPRVMPAPIAPGYAFDNLVFLGNEYVSAWAIKTSAGLILIDALENDDQAKAFIEDGLRAVGLDPKDIKILIITHAHGDHYGGAQYLIDRYKPQVVMSDADWKLLEDPAKYNASPRWAPPPKRDRTAAMRDTVTLGDTRVDLVVTPGHTPGTLSLIFPVKDNGRAHRAVLWGGTGFNFGKNRDQYLTYARSAVAVRDLVRTRGIDVFLSNHVRYDRADIMLDKRRADPAAANALIMTAPRVAKAFDVFEQCALSHADAIADGRE